MDRKLRFGSSCILMVFLRMKGSAFTFTSFAGLQGRVAGEGFQFSENRLSNLISVRFSSVCPLLTNFPLQSGMVRGCCCSIEGVICTSPSLDFFSLLPFSEERMPRYSSMRSLSGECALNMERKQSHSECTMASWMCSRRTVWQNWLKYSHNYCITVFISNYQRLRSKGGKGKGIGGRSDIWYGFQNGGQGTDFQLLLLMPYYGVYMRPSRPVGSFPSDIRSNPLPGRLPLTKRFELPFPSVILQYRVSHSSILNISMKTKPLINDCNFPKPPPKQPLFIVRPKPSQPRLQQPALLLTREQRSPTSSESPQRSIDECLLSLQGQLAEEQVMPRGVCLRVREHLLALRLRYHSEQQSYNDNQQEADLPTTLIRKPSNRFFRPQRTEAFDETRNKENLLSTESYSTIKMPKTKSKKEDCQIQIHSLETKLRAISERMQEYERDYRSFESRISKLEGELEKALREKAQLRAVFEEEVKGKSEAECQLRNSLKDIEERHGRLEKQYQQTSGFLEQREREIIALWQMLSK